MEKDLLFFYSDIPELAWRDQGKHVTLRIDSYLRPEAYLGDLGVDESLMSEEFWHTLREATKHFLIQKWCQSKPILHGDMS